MELGDEHGVQGRFQQSFGSVLEHIVKAQSINQRFADLNVSTVDSQNARCYFEEQQPRVKGCREMQGTLG